MLWLVTACTETMCPESLSYGISVHALHSTRASRQSVCAAICSCCTCKPATCQTGHARWSSGTLVCKVCVKCPLLPRVKSLCFKLEPWQVWIYVVEPLSMPDEMYDLKTALASSFRPLEQSPSIGLCMGPVTHNALSHCNLQCEHRTSSI